MRVNVIKCGSGSPLLFIHGIGDTAATWSPAMSMLEHRHTVVSFDLIGHGDSPVPDEPSEYTRDRTLEDIDEIIADLGRAPILVGHSLGGYLALAHAATRPGASAGIIVLNTGPGYRDPEKREAWNARSRRNAHRFGVVPQAAELNLQADGIVMESLPEMDIPTLFLAGTADRPEYAMAGQYLERKMPNCRFVQIDGGGHAMHEESHTVEIAEIIADHAKATVDAQL